MTDLARLVVKLEAQNTQYLRALEKANKKLDKFSKDSKKSFKQVRDASNRLNQTVTGLAAGFISLVSVRAGLDKLVSVAREFDVLNAQLITATGSAQGAETAFTAIQDFASKTPFDLQQSTKAFAQLVNLGLTPSERALTSYGDTASAMGKDLGQLVEAVADAATGEFERLKEFGIKAKSEGDRVTFTFRGIKTTVGKNAKDIEEFLIGLGENNFGGAMAERMATLDGALSNLGDSWDKLFLTISKQGTSSAMGEIVRDATAAIEELEAMIASGQLQAGIEAIGGKFLGFGEDIATSLDIVSDLLDDAIKEWQGNAESFSVFMSDAFAEMPENIRAFIQIMTVELIAFIEKAGAYGQEIADKLRFWDGDTFDLDAALEQTNSVRESIITAILAERDAAITSTNEQIAAATNLREQYNAMIAARNAANEGTDVLAQFKASGGEGNEDTGGSDKAKADFERIQKSLLSEEQLIAESYARRRQIIIDNTTENSEQQQTLLSELNDKTATQLFQHEAKLGNIHAQAALERLKVAKLRGDQQTNYELNRLKGLTAGVAQSSKTMFKLNKALTLASIAVSTPRAVAGAYAAGAEIGGPWLGAAYAALAAAAQLAQFQQAQSATFSGGGKGTTPSAIGTTPVINDIPVTPQPGNTLSGGQNPVGGGVTFIINGNISSNNAEQLLEDISRLINDGDHILIEAGSRNAQEIAA